MSRIDDNQHLVQLARQAQAGDRSAETAFIEELHASVRKEMRKIPHRHSGYKTDSDFVEEAVVEAWSDLDDFNGETDQELIAWASQILRHIFDTEMSTLHEPKRDVRRELPFADTIPESESGGNGLAANELAPDESAALREQCRSLMNSLSELHRFVVEQRAEGYSFEMIGHWIGRSPEAARQTWRRAIVRLRRHASAPPQRCAKET